tara:strand:- start:4 stop:207 length:204 start_codon:yes stop_codon:yes gene_type:complete
MISDTKMKGLLIIVGLFLIGCEDTREVECNECILDISASDLQETGEGQYILEYNQYPIVNVVTNHIL